MPRKKTKVTIQFAVRVPSEWMTRADALIDSVMPAGVEITRSDVMRMAIAEGLNTLEAQHYAKKKKT